MGFSGGKEREKGKRSSPTCLRCNGHYNRKPDLGDWESWWNTWDLASLSILDAKVLDRNVTWLSRHKDTS